MDGPPAGLRGWIVLLGAVAVFTTLFAVLGVPAAFLFGGVVGGAVCALSSSHRPEVPQSLNVLGIGVLGVTAGALLDVGVARTVAGNAVVVAGAVLGTLAASLVFGQLLRLHRNVSGTTAAFASIAGGAAGVIAVAKEVRADQQVVTTLQYLRVLVVIASIPLVTGFLPEGDVVATDPAIGSTDAGSASYAFALLALVAGLVLGRLLRFTASMLIVPLAVAAAMSLSGIGAAPVVPELVLQAAYVVIGVRVGLGFDRESIKLIARLLPTAFAQLALTIAACGGIGFLLATGDDISLLDGYLATTPGGIFAVTAISLASGANVAFVIALQVIRLIVALLLVPVLAALSGRQPPHRVPPA